MLVAWLLGHHVVVGNDWHASGYMCMYVGGAVASRSAVYCCRF